MPESQYLSLSDNIAVQAHDSAGKWYWKYVDFYDYNY